MSFLNTSESLAVMEWVNIHQCEGDKVKITPLS